MKYTTQMNAARQGIVTKEMEAVAAYEGIDVKGLMAEVAAGTIVIPANKNHKCLKPFGIGNSLKTKINVNLGTSRDCLNLDVEMEKVNKAVEMGAEAIMDLSSFGHTRVFRKKLVNECPAILGTVPIYDAIVYYNKALKVVEAVDVGYTDKRIEIKGSTELRSFAAHFNSIMDKNNELDSSRSEFVSNVSHELKTPITSIKVLADSLNTQEDVPVEVYKEFMLDIVSEIDRENKIIEDLLCMVRLDRASSVLNISSVNMNELLELVLKRLKPLAAKKNIELLFESFRPVVAQVDEVKITQVISNLVENAIKYNNVDGWVHVSLNADHQFFYVRVEDSGIGIPKDSQGKVFDRFYRVDKARSRETGGTGLGLSIVRNIILMHHGTIKLYSEEGMGTTFTFRIPLNYVEENEN